jgi:HlyD family secretion protein
VKWIMTGLQTKVGMAAGVVVVGLVLYYLNFSGTEGGNLLKSNGRIEATEIAVASKIAGRINDLLVDEGDFVEQGQLLATVESASLVALLHQAEAQLQQAKSATVAAQSVLLQRESEKAALDAVLIQRHAELVAARSRARRTGTLAETGSVSKQLAEDNDTLVVSAKTAVSSATAQIEAAVAGIASAKAQINSAASAVDAATATVARVQSELNDNQLKAPRAGRIQYRIALSGEIVAAGGKVLSLIDLTDVYMTFFLPSTMAGQVAIGSEVRVVLDAVPQVSIPAKVSYVADVAQFTPKTVETRSEREKLMFRVKAQISPKLLEKYISKVKTGLPGAAYLRLDSSQPWPAEVPELVQ